MEQMKKGDLLISKGKNFVVVEFQRFNDIQKIVQELYDFVDALLEKGYEIIDSRRTITTKDVYSINPLNAYPRSQPDVLYDERWVLKSPKNK